MRREELARKVRTYEWDKIHNQLHFGHSEKLKEYKKEIAEIDKALESES